MKVSHFHSSATISVSFPLTITNEGESDNLVGDSKRHEYLRYCSTNIPAALKNFTMDHKIMKIVLVQDLKTELITPSNYKRDQ